eukprot:COSAG02_NODE_3205_length_7171_cov_18.044118_1_plen_504_part_00
MADQGESFDDADRWRHQDELAAGEPESQIIARNQQKILDARRKEAEVHELAAMQNELERLRSLNDTDESQAIAEGVVQGPVVPLPRSKSGDYTAASKAVATTMATAGFASKWKRLGANRAQRRADARQARRSRGPPKASPFPVASRLKTPPGTVGTVGTVCRHPTLADANMRQQVSRVAVDDSRWDDAPPSPERVPSELSWKAAIEGKSSVPFRASKTDLSWLQEQSTLIGTVPKAPPLHPPAKGTKGFIGGGVGDTPYWLQSKPTIAEDRQRAAPAPLQQRSATEIRWGGVGTLSKQHRVTEERLLVARYVDEQRRRHTMGWRSPVHDESTGELSWRTSTPDPDARRRGLPRPQKAGRRQRQSPLRIKEGGLKAGPTSNPHERSYGKAGSFFAERDIFGAAATDPAHDARASGRNSGESKMAAFLASRGIAADGAASPPPHTPITAVEAAARAQQLELSDLGVSIESIELPNSSGEFLRSSQKLNLPPESLNDSISGVLAHM